MQNQQITQGQKVVSPVLDRVAKSVIFVLKRVGVWRPRRHNCTQTSLECPTTRREVYSVAFNDGLQEKMISACYQVYSKHHRGSQ